MRVLFIAAATGALLGATAPAGAQSQTPAQPSTPPSTQAPQNGQTQATTPPKTGCVAAAVDAPATPKSQDTAGGTAPGNTGNNGFTGAGISGSWTGTSQNGQTASSPSFQPATAKGLDPIGAPPKASSTGQC